jgi:hypothetical protein
MCKKQLRMYRPRWYLAARPGIVWIRREITRETAISMGKATNRGSLRGVVDRASVEPAWEGTTDKSDSCPGARLSPTSANSPSPPRRRPRRAPSNRTLEPTVVTHTN